MAIKINAGVDAQGNEIKVGRTESFFVPASSIKNDLENNSRHVPLSEEELAALASDLKQNGQMVPVLCRKLPDNSLVLVDGRNRHAAALMIEQEDPQFRLRVDVAVGMSPEDAFLAAVRANMFRAENQPLDHAYNIKRFLTQYGWDNKKIAAFYHKSEAWVLTHASLLNMPEAVRDAVEAGAMTVKDAFMVRQLPEAEVTALAKSLPVPPKPVKGGPVATLKRGKNDPKDAEQAAKEDADAGVDDIKSLLKGSKPAPKAKPAPVPVGIKQAKNKLIAEAARKSGVKVARVSNDLIKLLKGRNDAISEAIVGYLKGKIDGDILIDLLDTSEAPICK